MKALHWTTPSSWLASAFVAAMLVFSSTTFAEPANVDVPESSRIDEPAPDSDVLSCSAETAAPVARRSGTWQNESGPESCRDICGPGACCITARCPTPGSSCNPVFDKTYLCNSRGLIYQYACK